MPVLSKVLHQVPRNEILGQALTRIRHGFHKQSLMHACSPFLLLHQKVVQTPAQCYLSTKTEVPFTKKTKSSSVYLLIATAIAFVGVTSVSAYLYVKRNDQRSLFESSSLNFPKDKIKGISSPLETTSNATITVSSTTKQKSLGGEIPGLPTYTASDVASHDSAEKRIWVCFESGVYDITDFVPKHPGGDKILMAAGGALEPFWELFAIHKDPKILKMLEDYRIGNLRAEDREQLGNASDPFANDPKRHPVLKPGSLKPFNAEPPSELLVEHFLTPNEIFFVRNHLPVPEVDPDSYELEVAGIGIKSIHLTLQDLKTKFQKHTIVSTLQCAGNRRSELNKVAEVKGLNWGSAAISTAEWSGVRLVDVLRHAGVQLDDDRIQHIHFEGLDTDPSNVPYGASIPAEKGFDPKSDVLLAYEMNGKVLPRDHGYPIRVIVPGVVGARNVKWLGKIELSEEESKSHWQQNDYKGFSPNTTWENVDFTTAPAIQELPVNSAICKPQDNHKVKLDGDEIVAEGYAWSGGGRKIVRVDVSADGGSTWHNALLNQDSSPLNKSWPWTLWKISIPVPKERQKSGTEIEIICKAVDSSYNVQPDSFPPIWNLRGVLGNAWHRIKVKVQ